MQLKAFFEHWGIGENPFQAEEARQDRVFSRLVDETTHPDFAKVMGDVGQASSAVVFGEKGSGKTAFRLQLERRIEHHNAQTSEGKVWPVAYDEFNSLLDHLAQSQSRLDEAAVLDSVRLADHMDAILSRAVTGLIDRLLEGSDGRSSEPLRQIRKQRRAGRHELAMLAALYDRPARGDMADRFDRLRRRLGLGWLNLRSLSAWCGLLLIVGGGVAAGLLAGIGPFNLPQQIAIACVGGLGLLMLAWSGWSMLSTWVLARRLAREVRGVGRTAGQLSRALGQLGRIDRDRLPLPGEHDSRYQLTQRLLEQLARLGYRSMVVLVDRVDEPTAIHGEAERMRRLIWPMLDNKFLQQQGVGVKLLLPIELRYMLGREDSRFFQRARLDKQHMVDRLTWSGPLLYDLCNRRLAACRTGESAVSLADMFEEQVGARQIIDALDQMRQPRDAFKFLYQVISEHCASVSDAEPRWRISGLTLDQVRKQQSRRIEELQRGLGPA